MVAVFASSVIREIDYDDARREIVNSRPLLRLSRLHSRERRAGDIVGKFRIGFDRSEAARAWNLVAVGTQERQMPGECFGRIRQRLVKRGARRNAAGHVGKAHSVARPPAFVHQRDVARDLLFSPSMRCEVLGRRHTHHRHSGEGRNPCSLSASL